MLRRPHLPWCPTQPDSPERVRLRLRHGASTGGSFDGGYCWCRLRCKFQKRKRTSSSATSSRRNGRRFYRGLPKKFRTLCADLVIRIEDFATDEILDDMGIDSPFDLLGLFKGASLASRLSPAHL